MKKKIALQFAGLVLLIGILVLLFIPNTSAIREGYCVEASVTDISPSSIEIDEEFTVGIQIENCGEEIPENVEFEIVNPSPYIEIKEPLEMDVGKLVYSNSKRHITYNMKAKNNAKPGKYVLNTRLYYGKEGFTVRKDYNITFNVIGEESELNVASVETFPTFPKQGEETELVLRIENYGDGEANSVKVNAQHQFEGTKDSFIGTLDTNEESPAIFTFIPNESGTEEIPINIKYEDDFGKHNFSEKVELTFKESSSNWKYILITISVIVLILLIYLLYKRKVKQGKNGQES